MEENKMRLIDADAIDFSEIKDHFDRARAKIIIMGQPTIKPQYGVVNFSHRLIIATKFEEWCDECFVRNCKAHMRDMRTYPL
jgi:hypothetical protein